MSQPSDPNVWDIGHPLRWRRENSPHAPEHHEYKHGRCVWCGHSLLPLDEKYIPVASLGWDEFTALWRKADASDLHES